MLPVIIIPAYRPQQTLIELIKNLSHNAEQKIIVVDDGSGEAYANIFSQLAPFENVMVLHHAVNLGKGQALKTAFNYFLVHYQHQCSGVVTADADGQHLPKDILRISETLQKEPSTLILGARKFDGVVPLRSRFGNTLTRFIFKLLIGHAIHDTQTGLRGIPTNFLKPLLRLRTSGYDFELDMLICATQHKVKINEIPIQTIYENNNQSSHFNPLIDSLKIYFIFLRFCTLSVATALLDYIIFAISILAHNSLLTSFIIARLFAGTFNFTFGKRLVFKSKGRIAAEAIKFSFLVLVLMLASYFSVSILVKHFNVNVYLSKFLVEGTLFFASFAIQRIFVFSSKEAST